MKADMDSLYEATDNLINQQFYSGGQDIIIGRTAEVHLKISNSGQIIKKFKNMFNDNLNIFLKGNYKEFLTPFRKIKGVTDDLIKEINDELNKKLQYLQGTDFDTIVLYTIVLSALITRIRDLHFNSTIDEIRRRIKNKVKVSDSKIQDELDNLFMRNHDYISILYNISYLDALAESFNYKKVAHICKIQKGKYINRTVNLLISKF